MNKKTLFHSFLIIIVWSMAMAFVVFIGLNRFNLQPDNAYRWMDKSHFNAQQSLQQSLVSWDGKWYIDLAQNGYVFDPEGLSNVAFLPLYPALLKIVTSVTSSYVASALILNFIFLLGAVYFLLELGKIEKIDKERRYKSILYMLLYPTAIFFAVIYTEALFIFLVIATFYYLKKKKMLLAALLGMLAALTRIPGVFLFLPFIYYIWKNGKEYKTYVISLLIPLGTVIYLVAQKVATGNAFAFLTAQKNWGREFLQFNSYDHLYWQTSSGIVNSSLDILFVILLISSIFLVWKKLDPGYTLFTAAAILVPLASGSLLSIGRFGMVVFPIYLALAKVKNRWVTNIYLLVAIILLVFYTTQFVNGYWAG